MPKKIVDIMGGVRKPPPKTQNPWWSGGNMPAEEGLYERLGQGAGIGDLIRGYFGEYTGKPRHLATSFERMSPFIAGGLAGGDAYDYLQDFRNIDKSMQAYGVGAGQIARGAQQATRGAQQGLARAGLGRSAAAAGLAGRYQQEAGAQQAGLWTNLFQQRQRNVAEDAARAFDLNRMITQMVIGQVPPLRQNPPKQDNLGPLIGAGGQLAGGIGTLAYGLSALCWVAREVIPERWRSVRKALLKYGSEELIYYYRKHGQQIAAFLREHPELKPSFLPAMTVLADAGDVL